MLADNTAAASVASVTTATSTSNATPTPTTPSDPSPPLVFDGSCFCQSVSWRIKGKPLISIYCHCTLCQRMNGAAFVHGLHFPFTSLTWTTPATPSSDTKKPSAPPPPPPTTTSPTPPPTVSQTPPHPSHPWIIHRCKSCHSYIGATNTQTHLWSLKSAHLQRDPHTHLIAGFERIRPTAHIFYGTRVLDVPDGLPKWEGYENRSRRLDLA